MYQHKYYYTLTPQQVLETLRVNVNRGLSLREVEERRKKFGFNILPKHKQISRFILFLRQFQSFLVYLILLAAIISSDDIPITTVESCQLNFVFIIDFRKLALTFSLKMPSSMSLSSSIRCTSA